MGAVHVSEDVGFECGVDRYDAQPADDFGMVGDFLRTEQDTVFHLIDVFVKDVQLIIGQGERASSHEADAVFHHQVDDGVLYDLGVH